MKSVSAIIYNLIISEIEHIFIFVYFKFSSSKDPFPIILSLLVEPTFGPQALLRLSSFWTGEPWVSGLSSLPARVLSGLASRAVPVGKRPSSQGNPCSLASPD